MRFTIDADSDLARKITASKDMDMTLHITSHDPTFTNVEKLVTARLMSWTIRAGCQHAPDTMELEWLDTDKFSQMLPAHSAPASQ